MSFQGEGGLYFYFYHYILSSRAQGSKSEVRSPEVGSRKDFPTSDLGLRTSDFRTSGLLKKKQRSEVSDCHIFSFEISGILSFLFFTCLRVWPTI